MFLSFLPEKTICTDKKYYYHGDCVLDNIIVADNEVKFIDWRQDFCDDIIGGDIYYDLSKLNHSLIINHDLVNKNLFTYTEINENEIKTQVDFFKKVYDEIKKETSN